MELLPYFISNNGADWKACSRLDQEQGLESQSNVGYRTTIASLSIPKDLNSWETILEGNAKTTSIRQRCDYWGGCATSHKVSAGRL